jgi:pimeloyl-ACP methyl ester carboxylesterase
MTMVSLALLGGAIYLLWTWGRGQDVLGADGVLRHVHGPAWWLYAGAALAAWSLLGRFAVLALMPRGDDPPVHDRAQRMVRTANGAEIAVEVTGRADGPTLILTHGWGMDSSTWSWLRPRLADRFRLVAWDLPGLGRSGRPKSGPLSIEGLADALAAVVDATADRPAILVGHSIGGMVVQTLFRTQPEVARAKVAGVALLNTTYENPLRTMWLSGLWRTLQKPVLEPAAWLSVALFPLLWLSNWQSYLSGSTQLAMRLTGFGRRPTRRQVDHAALLATRNSPAVQAKGNLAMFHWSAGDGLRSMRVPTLVLAGARDIVTLPVAAEVICSRVPGARLSMIEGAGHFGPLEASEAYGREIAAFAETALATPRPVAAGDGATRARPDRPEDRPHLH